VGKCNILYVFIIGLFLLNFNSFKKRNFLKVNIDSNKVYQTVQGFGASDAWRCQFIGENWPEQKKERISELLFSKESDSLGNPKGIGLSIWRFYIGAGTTEQGESSDIDNEWRRSESFLDSKGNYDWTKQKGQQFLNKAKKYGVDQFLGFSITPPVQWTKNGKGYNGNNKDGEINLKEEYFDDYAEFMVNVLKHFDSKGISFNYLSPINEPQWDWERNSSN
jgi:O-glycosyl hydrolase